jgi:hypothetical protein
MQVDPRHFWKLVTIARQRRKQQRSGEEKIESKRHPFKDMWVDIKAIRNAHKTIVFWLLIFEAVVHLTSFQHYRRVVFNMKKAVDLVKLIPIVDEFTK